MKFFYYYTPAGVCVAMKQFATLAEAKAHGEKVFGPTIEIREIA